MKKEYSRSQSVALDSGNNGSVGQAYLLHDDEGWMTTSDRSRKDADAKNTDGRYIELLCRRYRDRGVASHVRADAAMQEKNEALTRAMAPGAYILAERLEKETTTSNNAGGAYRSGVSNGKRYMTVSDFDRYYHDQRGYKLPQYRVVPVENRTPVVTEQSVRGIQPKKAEWLPNNDKLPVFVQNFLRLKPVRFLNEWAAETFPVESVEMSQKKRAPIPVGVLASLVTVAVSMTMIIGSTVLVSQSTKTVSELKSDLAERQEISEQLSEKLDVKHDMLQIEREAIDRLGMVSREYATSRYMQANAEDEIVVYSTEERETNGWSALLSAVGFGSGS